MSKAKPDKSKKTKTKSVSSPEALTKASKKAGVSLSEDELKRVSGGVQKIRD
jgi:hypothetical protein